MVAARLSSFGSFRRLDILSQLKSRNNMNRKIEPATYFTSLKSMLVFLGLVMGFPSACNMCVYRQSPRDER